MRLVASLLLLSLAARASGDPVVNLKALQTVEASINEKIASSVSEPYDLLGPARGTYLEGYGAVFSVEVNLVLVSMLSATPFRPAITEDEKNALHDKKAKKLEGLKETMRGLMANAARSMAGLPGNERIVMEAFLFSYRWENTRGIPRRLTFSIEKQTLLDALNRHASPAELATLFTEEDL